jgi:CHASE2 domain-containing sensor protein
MTREKIAMAAALMVIGMLVSFGSWLSRIDHFVFDLGQRTLGSINTDGIVIVGIDQASLIQVGRWPWPRDIQASLLRKVCQARPKVVLLDIAYTEASADEQHDRMLIEQIEECANVVLPVVIESSYVGGHAVETLPLPKFADAASALGRVSVRMDDDGVARGVDAWEGVGMPSWPLLGAVTLQVAGVPNRYVARAASSIGIDFNPDSLVREGHKLLNFAGPPGSIASVSAVQVLEKSFPQSLFKDQLVLIGATAVGLGDQMATSSTNQGTTMAGVEYLANVIANIRGDKLVHPLPMLDALLCTAMLSIAPVLWTTRLMPLSGLMASLVWVAVLIVGSAILPLKGHIWFAPAGALVSAILVYPLWSWRRLEASRRHMDWELQQLAGTYSGTPPSRSLGYEQRMAYLQRAQARYRELQIQRDEMLAFFSHDIRAPLGIVATQIAGSELNERAKQRLITQINRAYDLAQGFLSLIRARSVSSETFEEVDLVEILHQSADAFYEKSCVLGVALIRMLPETPVWVHGDFGLLQRAADNLIQNALRYAPMGTPVTIALTAKGEKHRVEVVDEGPGVAPERLPHLFEKFSADTSARESGTSNGLGLYFVYTVADRHGGACGYQARPPHGSCFWIELNALEQPALARRQRYLQRGTT